MNAPELIALVWRDRTERIEAGLTPKTLILNPLLYKDLMFYHAKLGELPEGVQDYITTDSLFGLDICLDSSLEYKVL